MIIGLSGYAQSGKDTAAAQLAPHGFERRAFADKLKELAYRQNPPLYGSTLQRVVNQRGWEQAKRIPAVRAYLQELGIVHREVLGADVWVKALLDPIKYQPQYGKSFVVTDVRFRNEAYAITEMRGMVIRIERPGVGPVNGHESERAMDNYPFHAVIVNDGTPEELGAKVLAVVNGA